MGYAFTAADVGPKIDLLLDGNGYVFADLLEQRSLYSGHQKAVFGYTGTFVPRQNTSGGSPDNQQDFWYTFVQKDWSLGEQQKYVRQTDSESSRKYWRGKSVDIRIPGEVSIRPTTTSLTFASAPKAATGYAGDLIYVATTTTLYHVDYAGTITSDGAHGLGAAPSRFGVTADRANVWLSTTGAGTVGVRRWNGAAYSTWSATPADSLAFLNNTLYGYKENTGDLVRYSTAGAATVLYTWQDAAGTATTGVTSKLVPFGGKLLILRYRIGSPRGAELWLYDGVAPAKISEFPANFEAYDMEVINNTVFISGSFERYQNTSDNYHRPAIFFYSNGSTDLLWQATQYTYGAGGIFSPALTSYDGGLLFGDYSGARVVYYDADSGSFSTLLESAVFSSNSIFVAASSFALVIGSTSGTLGTIFPSSSTNAATAEVDTSLIDFDSSLPKVIRGIRADFTATGTGTVDLSYRFNDLDSSTYTSLQTNVTAGVEYALPVPAEGTTYRSISVRATLNRGATGTSQVTLKRLSVRGIPVHPSFKHRSYLLLLGGREGKSPVEMRDGTPLGVDGSTMAGNLATSATRTSPFSITDHLGTFTGVIENDSLEIMEYKPKEYIARFSVREV